MFNPAKWKQLESHHIKNSYSDLEKQALRIREKNVKGMV